jgi:hypothetical protein
VLAAKPRSRVQWWCLAFLSSESFPAVFSAPSLQPLIKASRTERACLSIPAERSFRLNVFSNGDSGSTGSSRQLRRSPRPPMPALCASMRDRRRPGRLRWVESCHFTTCRLVRRCRFFRTRRGGTGPVHPPRPPRQPCRSKITVRAARFGVAIRCASVHDREWLPAVRFESSFAHHPASTWAARGSVHPRRSSISASVRTTVFAYRFSK